LVLFGLLGVLLGTLNQRVWSSSLQRPTKNPGRTKAFSEGFACIAVPTGRIARIVAAFVKWSDTLERPIRIEHLRVAHFLSAILGWRLTLGTTKLAAR
jgi:hypothetical protein